MRSFILTEYDVCLIEQYLRRGSRGPGFRKFTKKVKAHNNQIQDEAKLLIRFLKALGD
jgi:hypothetical protein